MLTERNASPRGTTGDTRPVPALNELSAGTDVLILQNMGPIEDLAALSYESQLLINVSGPCWVFWT